VATKRWQGVDQEPPVLASQAARSAEVPMPLAKIKPCSTAGIPTVRLFLSSVSRTLRKERSCKRSTQASCCPRLCW
jgi:hypothetical protein